MKNKEILGMDNAYKYAKEVVLKNMWVSAPLIIEMAERIAELEKERKPLSLAQFIYAYYMEKNSTPNDLYSWMVKWGYLNKKEKGDE